VQQNKFMPSTQVKVLVLPVLRRYWLFHAWKDVPPQPPGLKPSWKETVQAKVLLTRSYALQQTLGTACCRVGPATAQQQRL
jgi:hypothetical protein